MLQVTVAYSPAPRQVREWDINLQPGSTAMQAILKCGVSSEFVDLDLTTLMLGVWGRHVNLSHVLDDNDRIEIYRPLRVDPKVARRVRFTGQGAKRAGLFANKRKGAKAGYGG